MSREILGPGGAARGSAKERGAPFLILDNVAFPEGPAGPAFLAAAGLSVEGAPRFLALTPGVGHDGPAWRAFLTALRADGTLVAPLLISATGDRPVMRAIEAVFPAAPVQISLVHRLWALGRTMDCRWPAACLAEARRIFRAGDRHAAVGRFRAWRDRWLRPGNRGWLAVRSLEGDLASCLGFYRFPPHLWRQIRTVNAITRLYRVAYRSGLLKTLFPSNGAGGPDTAYRAPARVAAGAWWFAPSIRAKCPAGIFVLDWIRQAHAFPEDSIGHPMIGEHVPTL